MAEHTWDPDSARERTDAFATYELLVKQRFTVFYTDGREMSHFDGDAGTMVTKPTTSAWERIGEDEDGPDQCDGD